MTSRFEELKGLRLSAQLKLEGYVSSLQIDENEAALKAEEDWINELEDDVHDFIELLKLSFDAGSLYLVKDSYEQIKSQFNKCQEIQNTHISLLGRDPTQAEMEWIISLHSLLSEINVKFAKYLRSDKGDAEREPKLKSHLKLQPFTTCSCIDRLRIRCNSSSCSRSKWKSSSVSQ